MRRVLIATTVAVAVGSARVPVANDHRWWSHVEVLADDSMEGRNTGSPAHKRAADYVATQFRRAGLDPAGDAAARSYIQPVSFNTRRIVEQRSSLALARNGSLEPLTPGDDANFSMRIDPAPAVDAPLVFVGYGLKVPELRIDDFEGLDLKGAARQRHPLAHPARAGRARRGPGTVGRDQLTAR